MKTILILIVLLTAINLFPQSLIIQFGAEVNIGTGADVCVQNGIITGNVTGSGTHCGNPFLPPNTPLLVSPVNNCISVSLTPLLIWDTIPEAAGYKIFISTDSSFLTLTDSVTVETTTYSVPSGVLDSGYRYFWKVAGYNYFGNSPWSIAWSFVTVQNLTVNLKAYLEGFWTGIYHVSDTLRLYLAKNIYPYEYVDSTELLFSTNGTGTYNFTKCPSDNYYIVIKHRNHLETWSGLPQTIETGLPLSYDFTTAQTQAYGSNLIFKNGSWCIFGGDINQDGFIDGADMAPLDNDLYNYVSGYVITDLNGDQFVDGSDMAILDNNLYNYIGVVRPGGSDGNQRSVILKLEQNRSKTIWDVKEKPDKVIKK